jgi:riboflavin synthase alpha subunit
VVIEETAVGMAQDIVSSYERRLKKPVDEAVQVDKRLEGMQPKRTLGNGAKHHWKAACCPAVAASQRIGGHDLSGHRDCDPTKGILNSSEATVSRQTRRYLFGQNFLARMNSVTKHTWRNRRINVDGGACSRQVERLYQMTNTNIREA